MHQQCLLPHSFLRTLHPNGYLREYPLNTCGLDNTWALKEQTQYRKTLTWMNLSFILLVLLPYFYEMLRKLWITNFRAYCLPALIRGSSARPPPPLFSSDLCLAGDTTWHFLLLPQDASCRADFIFLFLGLLPCVGEVQPPEVSKKESVKDKPPFCISEGILLLVSHNW